jgi:apolipoprotein N-acyltransferase
VIARGFVLIFDRSAPRGRGAIGGGIPAYAVGGPADRKAFANAVKKRRRDSPQDASLPSSPPALSPFARLSARVILADGWTRRLIAFASGAVGALALAPFGFFPVALVPMMGAVWLVDGSARLGPNGGSWRASVGAAFRAGWWWGFGYFIAGLWWLGAAFLVDADRFGWLLPLGVIVVPAGLALFPALGFAAARSVWPSGGARILALAAGLGASEWLRGVVLTGFPWNDLGMMLGTNLTLAQIASIGGLHSLTFLAIAIFAAPATLADGRGGARPIVVAGLALAAIAAFGAFRLQGGPTGVVRGVKLRIMQADIAQGEDFNPANKDAILGEYIALSDRATSPTTSGVADVTHLIWPESAFPFLIARDPKALDRIAAMLRGGATLITGAARAEREPGDRRDHYFNSIQVIDRAGTLLNRYDKVRLVPFGEYMPLGFLWDRIGLSQFVHVPGGFDAGRQAQPLLSVPGLPDARPMVCYEAIFPDEIGTLVSGARLRAGLILNVTDDAWFGFTPGPHQHFAQARLRAIEQGLPLVRAANTGESAIIDSKGRIVAALPLGVEGVLDGPLPVASPPTIYSAFGFIVPGAMLIAFAMSALIARRHAD